MNIFNDYLAAITNSEQKARLNEALTLTAQIDAQLEPRLENAMPAFFIGDKPIIFFAVTKKHFDVYPTLMTLDQFDEEITSNAYPTANGAILIKWDKPVDWSMLTEIIKFNIAY
ncbi:hypothetical protein EQG49_10505 [Periweissella cryptocerci]|uniref:YdhG-like domain-containing protein n=1 Tax=Periweissella cryptocerci TaxID=2506420 RepID=A0A4P6YVN6_9LACO|nr:DUF1801 domain-containing protein [Periweissella cryptocerci]QBO36841.1 hypothetical protein EQG49_10505 [Periweissella cryptocerci]